eukprot:evm.model.scf_4952.2 EVM.evm.TU.scf_4952.2   scf_4952:2653-4203(+)
MIDPLHTEECIASAEYDRCCENRMAPFHVTISGKRLMSHPVEASIICPHCWHEFYGDQALYISEHPEMFGDPVLGDAPGRISPQEVTRDEDGRVFDPQGWPVRERACPRCHLPIPPELLSQRPRVVSIVGVPGFDRTYLTPVMLYQLRRTLSVELRSTLEMLDSRTSELLAEKMNRIFGLWEPARPINLRAGPPVDNTVLLDGISMLLPQPLLLAAQAASRQRSQATRGKQQCLALFENTGESFPAGGEGGGDRRTTLSTQHLQESDAVLFAYDPLLESETRSYDVWRPLVDHFRDDTGEPVIDSSSVMEFPDREIAALDITKINIVSWIVRSLLMDISPEIVLTAEASFEVVRYFPVSALGHRPQFNGDQLTIKPSDVHPFRMDHPMLWLLREWSVIQGFRTRRENPRQLPEAHVTHVSEREVRVACPETSQLFQLDKDYAGHEFYNPDTGKYFWIPRV